MQIGGLGQQPRHRGLAGARRPPKDHRAKRARLQHSGERAVRAEQVVLADHVGELTRPKLVRERPRCVALEACGGEQVGCFGLGTRAHRKVLLTPSPCPRGVVTMINR